MVLTNVRFPPKADAAPTAVPSRRAREMTVLNGFDSVEIGVSTKLIRRRWWEPTRKGMKKREREEHHAQEIEENQAALRRSIAETSRLVSESEAMLQRHKSERDQDEDED